MSSKFLGSIFGGSTYEATEKEAPEPIKESNSNNTMSHMSSSSYESDYEPEDQGGVDLMKIFPRDNLKTNIICVLLSSLSHYIYGIFFNALESVNSKYQYPNVGSMAFVIATALFLTRFDLTLKSLSIDNRNWKYPIYKMLAVMFLTHLILAGIWQQLVNLTLELVFIMKDFLEVLHLKTGSGILETLSCYITVKRVMYLTYAEGLGILLFVLYNSSDCSTNL